MDDSTKYAFPTSRETYYNADGLTKREYFAGLIAAALMGKDNTDTAGDVACSMRWAVKSADILIRKLAEEQEDPSE